MSLIFGMSPMSPIVGMSSMSSIGAMSSWLDAAEEMQQKLCNELGDRIWNAYSDTQIEHLRGNIAYALYGLPANVKTGYSSEKLDAAKKMCSVIKGSGTNRSSSKTLMSVIFVVFHNDNHHAVPEAVFRIPRSADRHIFVDRNRRVYYGWNDYKESNKLPVGRYCYPVSGVYKSKSDGRVRVDYGPTPAATLKQKALRVADKTATAVAVTSGVVMVASVFVGIPPMVVTTAQFAGAGAGVYGAGRGMMTLADRFEHNEEIGLGNSEARDAWLNIAGGVLGVAGLAAGRWGLTVSPGVSAMNCVKIGLLAKNGLVVVNLGEKLRAKHKKGKLTTLDVCQFSATCLFFGMSAYTFKMAKARITEGRLPASEGLVPLGQEVRTIETVDTPCPNISAEDVTKLVKFLAVDVPKLIGLFGGSDPQLTDYHDGFIGDFIDGLINDFFQGD